MFDCCAMTIEKETKNREKNILHSRYMHRKKGKYGIKNHTYCKISRYRKNQYPTV